MTSMVIQTVSTVDAIEAQFRQNILDGAWAPGEKIPSEKELGNLLGGEPFAHTRGYCTSQGAGNGPFRARKGCVCRIKGKRIRIE